MTVTVMACENGGPELPISGLEPDAGTPRCVFELATSSVDSPFQLSTSMSDGGHIIPTRSFYSEAQNVP